jgi:hypothetical protein
VSATLALCGTPTDVTVRDGNGSEVGFQAGDPIALSCVSTDGKPCQSIFPSTQAASFAIGLNRRHFGFQHSLANHPLFAIPRLLEVHERIMTSGRRGGLAAWEAAQPSPSRKFGQLPKQANIQEAVRGIAEGRDLLRLSGAHEFDPRYKEIHDRILDEAGLLSGFPLRRKITWSSMAILLSSPGVITPYHMDHQSNLLFQIQGEKDIWLFDPKDRRVLTEDEVERYYAGSVNAADYREAPQPAAHRYRLAPGLGVHNPSLGPHWVRNGPGVSVSVSVNFSLGELEARARVYQMNRYLRRLGFSPRPPEESRMRDRLKSEAMKLMSKRYPKNLEELLDSVPRRFAGRLRAASARSRALLK